MKAEIIAIGSELLIGHVVNTNATYLSEELNLIGINVFFHTTVGDNPKRIKECLKLACERSDLVFCTGGLGPTVDDLTHSTIADFFNLRLLEDEKQKAIIIEKFAGREVPKINYRQACVPEGGQIIPNPVGTAIGIILDRQIKTSIDDKTVGDKTATVITFPGVPCEMEAMFQQFVLPYLKIRLQKEGDSGVIVSRKVKLTGITESKMAQIINDLSQDENSTLFHRDNPSVAPYATLGECYLRITARAESEHKARNLIQPVQMEIENILGEYIFGYDNDTMQGVLAKMLREYNLSIAFAESCTGGLISKLMTDIPGSSDYTKMNIVTYSNDAKEKFLQVSPLTLEKYGAVSEQTAQEMAEGLSKISDADICVSVTGIAGPDGATPEKPIGTVYVAVKMREQTHIQKLDWHSTRFLSREMIRELAAKKTIYTVYKLLRNSLINSRTGLARNA